MPAIFAHKLLAEIVKNDYDNNVSKIISKNYQNYLTGSLGPDPLYFYGFMKKLPLTNKANNVHRTYGKIFFNHKVSEEKELAYMFGMISHFTLDKNVHKYIHKIEKEYSHVKLESELEYLLLKNNHIDYLKYDFSKHIFIDKELILFVSKLFDIQLNLVKKIYSDTNLIVKFSYNQNKIIRKIVNIIMKITNNYDDYKDMLLSKQLNENNKEPLDVIYDLWLNSVEETIINVNNYYNFVLNKEKLNENFNFNFEGEEDE